MLEEKLVELKKEVIEYAALAERMIAGSIKGLIDKDKGLLEDIMKKQEIKSNNLEIEIDQKCTNLIAQFQPTATNLRSILMILKMNNDLERMADHAVNICQSAKQLIDEPTLKYLDHIKKMAESTTSLLKNSIDSFSEEDSDLAKDVCERDYIVDNFRIQIIKELIKYMGKDPEYIESSLHLMRISSNLERIADLATNIAEDVIFMVEGTVIKHHKDEAERKGS